MSDTPTPAPAEPKKSGHGGHKKHAPIPQWSKDFPISQEQSEYVGRRDFTKLLVFTSVGLLATQTGLGVYHAVARHDPPTRRVIASISAISVGQAMSFEYPSDGDRCILVRRSETEFVAFSQKCTHLNCPVIPRVAAGEFQCPCHAGRFDLASGRAIAGPPRRALTKITLDIRDGTLYATGLEEQTA